MDDTTIVPTQWGDMEVTVDRGYLLHEGLVRHFDTGYFVKFSSDCFNDEPEYLKELERLAIDILGQQLSVEGWVHEQD
jgi:hypothetical protein